MSLPPKELEGFLPWAHSLLRNHNQGQPSGEQTQFDSFHYLIHECELLLRQYLPERVIKHQHDLWNALIVWLTAD